MKLYNGLLASFSTKSSEILGIFTRHLTRVRVSLYLFLFLSCCAMLIWRFSDLKLLHPLRQRTSVFFQQLDMILTFSLPN